MTKTELKQKITANGSHFFDRKSMKFFGDTMRNYGVRESVVDTLTQKNVEVYELYRKRPVKNGLAKSAYFDRQTFKKVHAA